MANGFIFQRCPHAGNLISHLQLVQLHHREEYQSNIPKLAVCFLIWSFSSRLWGTHVFCSALIQYSSSHWSGSNCNIPAPTKFLWESSAPIRFQPIKNILGGSGIQCINFMAVFWFLEPQSFLYLFYKKTIHVVPKIENNDLASKVTSNWSTLWYIIYLKWNDTLPLWEKCHTPGDPLPTRALSLARNDENGQMIVMRSNKNGLKLANQIFPGKLKWSKK